jgi:hypothetical protein
MSRLFESNTITTAEIAKIKGVLSSVVLSSVVLSSVVLYVKRDNDNKKVMLQGTGYIKQPESGADPRTVEYGFFPHQTEKYVKKCIEGILAFEGVTLKLDARFLKDGLVKLSEQFSVEQMAALKTSIDSSDARVEEEPSCTGTLRK